MAPVPKIHIRYEILLEDGESLAHDFVLDSQKLILDPVQGTTAAPAWAALEFNQCTNCTLKKEEHPQCPIAAQLGPLVDKFADRPSYSKATVTVHTSERDYRKETTLQEALFSIFGLVMATSGCPIMKIVKPLARFHLPFATLDENIVRSISMYLLRQYFQFQQGKDSDYRLDRLEEFYRQIQVVNKGFLTRIRATLRDGDASENGITALDCISKMLSLQLHNDLKKYAYLFE